MCFRPPHCGNRGSSPWLPTNLLGAIYRYRNISREINTNVPGGVSCHEIQPDTRWYSWFMLDFLLKPLHLLFDWIYRRWVGKGHLRLLRVEINQAIDRATAYPTSPKAPAWRCATEGYDGQFASLTRIFDSNEIATIKGAYADMVDFNQCLDYVNDARGTSDFEPQVERARIKAGHVRKSAPEALAVVDAVLQK